MMNVEKRIERMVLPEQEKITSFITELVSRMADDAKAKGDIADNFPIEAESPQKRDKLTASYLAADGRTAIDVLFHQAVPEELLIEAYKKRRSSRAASLESRRLGLEADFLEGKIGLKEVEEGRRAIEKEPANIPIEYSCPVGWIMVSPNSGREALVEAFKSGIG